MTKSATRESADSVDLSLAGGTMTGDTAHGDNVKAKFGTGNDLNIYHDGSDSYIKDDGTGSLWVASNEFRVANAGVTENMIIATENAAVKLYHNNALKLETTATGVAVTGGVALGGTAAANTLSDYEEGTFTGAASGVTATVQNTKYTKIGRLVYVTGHIICTANATADVSISGLPFAIAGSENGIGTAMNYNVNIAGGSTYNFVTYVQGSSIRFYRSEDNSPWLWAGAGTLNNGSQILFNVTYQAA